MKKATEDKKEFQECKKEFERWAGKYYILDKIPKSKKALGSGYYEDKTTQTAWDAWLKCWNYFRS
jgi:hypothetical protein